MWFIECASAIRVKATIVTYVWYDQMLINQFYITCYCYEVSLWIVCASDWYHESALCVITVSVYTAVWLFLEDLACCLHTTANTRKQGGTVESSLIRYIEALSYQHWGIPIIKVRRSWDHLIFMVRILILVRQHLYTELSPWYDSSFLQNSHNRHPIAHIQRWDMGCFQLAQSVMFYKILVIVLLCAVLWYPYVDHDVMRLHWLIGPWDIWMWIWKKQ